jgi:hypothetical protein
MLALVLLLAAGCALGLGLWPSAVTEEELYSTCLRTGGWWRGDLIAGYCEYQAPGFL